MPRARRSAHRRQRGQAVPVIALAAAVLVGSTALAVDLSLNTHTRRTLQNITDSAALAGARDLPASVAQTDRQQAVFDAMAVLDRALGQPLPTQSALMTSITTGAGNDCNPGVSHCHVAFTIGLYSGTVDTPPRTASHIAYDRDGYLEVNLAHTTTNNFGQAVGQPTSTERGHSVGYHFAPNQALGLALFADTYVGTGNDGELIEGNVYAQRYVNPQSAGLAGFCAGLGGRIVLGAPQAPMSYDSSADPGQADILPHTANVILTLPNCNPLNDPVLLNTTAAGTVNQTVANPTDCSNPIPGLSFPAQYSDPLFGGVGTCVANPALPPPSQNFEEPSYAQTPVYGCNSPPSGTGWYECDNSNRPALVATSGTMPPGVYVIDHGSNNNCKPTNCYDIDFSRVTVNAPGVTILLINGATMGVEKGADVTIDPTQPPCVQSKPTDCKYSIYSGSGSSSQLFIKDNGSTLTLFGTLFMVAGTVNCDSNAFLQIVQGQAIVGTWNVQSGNHDNPIITFDSGMVAPQTEVLRLAE